ncbi:hypothetical protein DH2020_020467 [Rehmannia glutinosa]|uniref:Pectinesterase n=1 Tax=Rehmannia glutinosa TaxID=99300 RepID=A0ABR0WIB8_REHGL
MLSFMLSISIDNPFSTPYPNTCYDNLSPQIDYKNSYDPQFLYNISVQVTINEISKVLYENFTGTRILTRTSQDIDDFYLLSALESCRDFLSLALYNLNWSLPTSGSALTTRETRTNFRTWLSAAGADLQACMDGFEYAPDEVRKVVTANLNSSIKLVTTSLAIISKIDDYMSSHEFVDIIDTSSEVTINWEPTSDWLSSKDKNLIHNSKHTIQPDVVVAKDGSGMYKTINEAINDVPRYSNKRFVIYVKKGVYNENVRVEKEKWNVLMYGDGMSNTIISSNRSNRTGTMTKYSATFAVYGKGFIAKDIGFQNTAGADKGQAVALFSASDQSVFYRCLRHTRKKANTLSERRYNCSRKIGSTFQHGYIDTKMFDYGHENLGRVKTFLGRPWKDYSTVVVMESQLGSLIDQKGWSSWGNSRTGPDTIHYVEYNNVGPGAVTTNRVRWKGLRIDNTQKDASKFTVRSFIDGDKWIPSTGVPFQADM